MHLYAIILSIFVLRGNNEHYPSNITNLFKQCYIPSFAHPCMHTTIHLVAMTYLSLFMLNKRKLEKHKGGKFKTSLVVVIKHWEGILFYPLKKAFTIHKGTIE